MGVSYERGTPVGALLLENCLLFMLTFVRTLIFLSWFQLELKLLFNFRCALGPRRGIALRRRRLAFVDSRAVSPPVKTAGASRQRVWFRSRLLLSEKPTALMTFTTGIL